MTDERPATTAEVLKMLATLREQVVGQALETMTDKMKQELVLRALKRDIRIPTTKQEGR